MKKYNIIIILILTLLISSCGSKLEPITEKESTEPKIVETIEDKSMEDNIEEIESKPEGELIKELNNETGNQEKEEINKTGEVKTEIITENKSDLNQTLINNLNEKLAKLKIDKKEYDLYKKELDIEMEPDLSEWE